MTSSVHVAYDWGVFGQSLTADPRGIEGWRTLAGDVVRHWGAAPEVVELVRLGVSELISNVVRHVADRPRCYLRIVLIGSEVTVQLFDRSVRIPVIGTAPDWDAEDGRGLWMLREMAARFGCKRTRNQRGKIVWFSCDLAGDLR